MSALISVVLTAIVIIGIAFIGVKIIGLLLMALFSTIDFFIERAAAYSVKEEKQAEQTKEPKEEHALSVSNSSVFFSSLTPKQRRQLSELLGVSPAVLEKALMLKTKRHKNKKLTRFVETLNALSQEELRVIDFDTLLFKSEMIAKNQTQRG